MVEFAAARLHLPFVAVVVGGVAAVWVGRLTLSCPN